MTTKTTYNLSKLIAQTADIEVLDPITQEVVTTITILPADDPKIQTLISEVLGDMPKEPTDSGSIGAIVAYANAGKIAKRKVIAARIVKTDHPDLATPAQISDFIMNCRYEIIEQIDEEGSERSIYFR